MVDVVEGWAEKLDLWAAGAVDGNRSEFQADDAVTGVDGLAAELVEDTSANPSSQRARRLVADTW
jgi:hypothetical protein